LQLLESQLPDFYDSLIFEAEKRGKQDKERTNHACSYERASPYASRQRGFFCKLRMQFNEMV
jgi:hypothetical protein